MTSMLPTSVIIWSSKIKESTEENNNFVKNFLSNLITLINCSSEKQKDYPVGSLFKISLSQNGKSSVAEWQYKTKHESE